MTIMPLIYFILIGLIAGFLAGKLTKGSGFGVLGNIIIGVIGALVGGFVFGLLGIGAYGLLGQLVVATLGAIILLALLRVAYSKKI